METGTKIALVVAGAVATALVVAVVVEGTAKAAAPVVPPAPLTLTPGHRYGLQVACPFPFPGGLPPVGATSAVALLLGISGVSVVNYSPASDGKSFSAVFDYSGAAVVLPTIQAGGGTSCTSDPVDMGPTPAGG